MDELPPLVARAHEAARQARFRDEIDFAGLVSLLRVGGRIVMDDLTTERALAPDSLLRADDVKRRFFSTESRLFSTEVVLPDLENSLLVGTRTS